MAGVFHRTAAKPTSFGRKIASGRDDRAASPSTSVSTDLRAIDLLLGPIPVRRG
jgi:hypothetical protein